MNNPAFSVDSCENVADFNSTKASNGDAGLPASKETVVSLQMEEKKSNSAPSGAHGIPVEHPTSYTETVMHLFKGNVGSGIYAMGDAFKNAGLIFGAIVTVLLGVISVHCQHILLSQSERLQREQKLDHAPDFATTVELSFSTGPVKLRKMAPCMRRLVNIFLCITQLGFCCVYFVFVATNLQKILDRYDVIFDLHLHMVIVLLPILLSCMIRNLKYLTPFSMLANLMMIVGLAITLYFACTDLPHPSERPYIADWSRLPLYFGTTIYAFEGIGLVLPLKNEMREPKHFQKPLGVLNTGMFVVISLITSVGFIGYLKWGEEVAGSLTLNLPKDDVLSVVVQGLLLFAIMFSFPIQFYVPVDIIWPQIQEKFGPFKSPVAAELILRCLLVLLTFALAEAIPELGLFISLVGAISSTALALLFPPIIELVTKHRDLGRVPFFIALKNGFILLIGVVGFFTGSYASIRAIVEAFLE
ncbi:proton-coupled amino acid transporter-like protein acs [Arctopsyche grandis]|uniref:proton-coupled amino acid transporter-like protein acs n=1 Tax=Arctopsyche grandis TaxID=121162 RepID=UPI00406DA1CC